MSNVPAIKTIPVSQIKSHSVLNYASGLDYAHQNGIQRLEVNLIQAPSEGNNQTAICSATLVTKNGQTFTDIAEASPATTPSGSSLNCIHTASTRAKARVLADGCNIAVELHEQQGEGGPWDEGGKVIDVSYVASPPTPQPPEAFTSPKGGGGDKPASDKQRRLIEALSSQKGKNAAMLAVETFGKGLEELKGSEADLLIKTLNK